MAKQVRVRRDTLTNLNAVIPADGEIAFNTSDDRIHMGDGSTYGGIPHPNFKDILNSKFEYAVAGGTGNALTVDLPYDAPSYGAGLRIKVKATANNTGAATIDVDGLGTKNIYKMSAGTLGNLVANDLVNGGIYELIYDGTQFQLLTLTNSGITGVSQGNVNSTTQAFSNTAGSAITSGFYRSSTAILMSGGSYGFRLASGTAGGGVSGWFEGDDIGGSYGAICWAANSGVSVNGNQRYITSSPPFDLGDGEVQGFLYFLMDGDDIIGHSCSEIPQWVYNGPTNTRADHICPITGKKFRKKMRDRSLTEIMDGAEIIYDLDEITDKVKNADMELLPTPFLRAADQGYNVVMIDPMDERVKALIEYQNAGGTEDIFDAIKRGLISVSNDKAKSKGPQGVEVKRLKYKYSG